MTEIAYYRWSALLPLVLPPLAYLIFWHENAAVGWLDNIVSLVVVSGIFGGPVYLPFMVGLLWFLRRRPVRTYRTVSLLTPLLFAAVFMVSVLVLTSFTHSSEQRLTVLLYLPSLLVVGYGYVGLIHVLRVVLSLGGLIQTDATNMLSDTATR